MMSPFYISLLHATLTFLPLALTFPENPNSIDSPKAWHPQSTGIGKLPAGSLRAWWDASKLNANDVYWGYPRMIDSSSICGGHNVFTGHGMQNQNILTIEAPYFIPVKPGFLLKIENEATTYEIVSTLNSNTFIVSPNFTHSFTNRPILVAQLLKWPDLSGNREHMVFGAVADTHNPGIYILEGASGKIFRDGYIYHFGKGQQRFSALNSNDVLRIGHSMDTVNRNSMLVHELIIGQGSLSESLRAEVEGYLAWKWQSQEQLPISHSYATQSPTSSWDPTQLGNTLWMWLDANRSDRVFTDAMCSSAALADGQVGCWQDLSSYNRHMYQNANLPIHYVTHQGMKGIRIQQSSPSHPASLATQDGAVWLNDQNFFIAMVAQKTADQLSYRTYRGGPLLIGDKPFFPFVHEHCIGVETVNGNPMAYTEYTSQRSTFLLQGNVRNRAFYQPYFHKNISSSLTTRGPPTYLHEQPYLLAVVADFMSSKNGATLLGTVVPAGTYAHELYVDRYLAFGSTIKSSNWKLWLDHGWNDYEYNRTVSTEPAVYLAWFKLPANEPQKNITITVNGLPIEFSRRVETRSNGYLRVLPNEIAMLSMGDHAMGGPPHGRFSGSIYEAMVIIGPKIKYGHQRLIEGYLMWKWGLQKQLPKSHSYRYVPPAR